MTDKMDRDEATMNYLKARHDAGTPDGIAYANRLAAMPPDDAAAEIFEMFGLCHSEDLAEEIAGDLQLPFEAAERIAYAITRRRGGIDFSCARLRALVNDITQTNPADDNIDVFNPDQPDVWKKAMPRLVQAVTDDRELLVALVVSYLDYVREDECF